MLTKVGFLESAAFLLEHQDERKRRGQKEVYQARAQGVWNIVELYQGELQLQFIGVNGVIDVNMLIRILDQIREKKFHSVEWAQRIFDTYAQAVNTPETTRERLLYQLACDVRAIRERLNIVHHCSRSIATSYLNLAR